MAPRFHSADTSAGRAPRHCADYDGRDEQICLSNLHSFLGRVELVVHPQHLASVPRRSSPRQRSSSLMSCPAMTCGGHLRRLSMKPNHPQVPGWKPDFFWHGRSCCQMAGGDEWLAWARSARRWRCQRCHSAAYRLAGLSTTTLTDLTRPVHRASPPSRSPKFDAQRNKTPRALARAPRFPDPAQLSFVPFSLHSPPHLPANLPPSSSQTTKKFLSERPQVLVGLARGPRDNRHVKPPGA